MVCRKKAHLCYSAGCEPDPADVLCRAPEPDPADVRHRAVGLDLQIRPVEYKVLQSAKAMN